MTALERLLHSIDLRDRGMPITVSTGEHTFTEQLEAFSDACACGLVEWRGTWELTDLGREVLATLGVKLR